MNQENEHLHYYHQSTVSNINLISASKVREDSQTPEKEDKIYSEKSLERNTCNKDTYTKHREYESENNAANDDGEEKKHTQTKNENEEKNNCEKEEEKRVKAYEPDKQASVRSLENNLLSKEASLQQNVDTKCFSNVVKENSFNVNEDENMARKSLNSPSGKESALSRKSLSSYDPSVPQKVDKSNSNVPEVAMETYTETVKGVTSSESSEKSSLQQLDKENIPSEAASSVSKDKRNCRIKCSKKYKQIVAEKSRNVAEKGRLVAAKGKNVAKCAASVAKDAVIDCAGDLAKDALKDYLEDMKFNDTTSAENENAGDDSDIETLGLEKDEEDETEKVKKRKKEEKKEKNKCKIKGSKNYRQIIEEKSKRAAEFAARKAREAAMQYVNENLPKPAADLLNDRLKHYGPKEPPKGTPQPSNEEIVMRKVRVKGDNGEEIVKVVKCRRKKNKISPLSSKIASNERISDSHKMAATQKSTNEAEDASVTSANFLVSDKLYQTKSSRSQTNTHPDSFNKSVKDKHSFNGDTDAANVVLVSTKIKSNEEHAQVGYRNQAERDDSTKRKITMINSFEHLSNDSTQVNNTEAMKLEEVMSDEEVQDCKENPSEEKRTVLPPVCESVITEEISRKKTKNQDTTYEKVLKSNAKPISEQIKFFYTDVMCHDILTPERPVTKQMYKLDSDEQRVYTVSDGYQKCLATSIETMEDIEDMDEEFEIVDDDEEDHDKLSAYGSGRKSRGLPKVKVRMPGLTGEGAGGKVTALMEGMSKCTSVGGIARTVAPKVVNGVLGNAKVKQAWQASAGKTRCCQKCSSHCEAITKIIITIVSITVVTYDVAMMWTAFAAYFAHEGGSPITIVFGIICSIATILMGLEIRNTVMICLVTAIQVKRLVSFQEKQKARRDSHEQEKWVEVVTLLELLLADFPTIIILSLTINYASCGLYKATFKRSIMGKLALYAVCISALWKGIISFVQFCLSKPFHRGDAGGRAYFLWTLFRCLRPLVALALLFFAIYVIMSINGVSIKMMGKDETRPDCLVNTSSS